MTASLPCARRDVLAMVLVHQQQLGGLEHRITAPAPGMQARKAFDRVLLRQRRLAGRSCRPLCPSSESVSGVREPNQDIARAFALASSRRRLTAAGVLLPLADAKPQ